MRLSEEAKATIDELKKHGASDIWPESGGKHLKVHYSWKGETKFMTCALSGSDHRGPANARTEVRHALGVVGQGKTHDKTPPREQRNHAPKPKPEMPPLTLKGDPFAVLAQHPAAQEGKMNGSSVIIGAPPGDMRIEFTQVTPDMARDWLHDNTRNRRLRDGQVNELVQAILRGEWKITHQPIAFDKAGVLLDGQHRLHACVRSGKTLPMLVAFDADRNSYDCLDIGARRSLADITGIGEKEASMLRFMTQIVVREYGKSGTKAVTPQQAEKVWPYVSKAVRAVLAEAPSPKRFITTAPLMSAAAIRIVGGERQQYVLTTWRDVYLQNFRDLPPVAESFLKQLLNDSTRKRITDYDLFSRAWKMFDEDNIDLQQIRISDPGDAILEAKGTLLAAMGLRIKEER